MYLIYCISFFFHFTAFAPGGKVTGDQFLGYMAKVPNTGSKIRTFRLKVEMPVFESGTTMRYLRV